MNTPLARATGPAEKPAVSATENAVRILHTSDWQLGMKFAALGEDGQARFREARLAAIERVFTVAKDRHCDAIVVAGDVFDHNLLDRQVYRRAMDVLAGAPCPVYLLPGNHDPLDAASIYGKAEFQALAARETAPVIVLDDSQPREIPGRHDALAPAFVVGAPLKSKRASEDLVNAVAEELRSGAGAHRTSGDLGEAERGSEADGASRANETGRDENATAVEWPSKGEESIGVESLQGKNWDARINVLIGHGAVEGFGRAYDPSLINVAVAAEACRERVMDYVALGDTHSAIQLHEDSTVWYSGAPEVTAFLEPYGGGESNSGKVLIVDIAVDATRPREQARVSVEEAEVGEWRFLALAADLTSREDVEDFLAHVESLPRKRQTAVKYALSGALSLGDNAYLEDRLEQLKDGFAALYPRERLMNLKTLIDVEQLGEESFGSGFVGQAARALAARSESDGVANDALKLLFRIHSMNTHGASSPISNAKQGV